MQLEMDETQSQPEEDWRKKRGEESQSKQLDLKKGQLALSVADAYIPHRMQAICDQDPHLTQNISKLPKRCDYM